MDWGSVVVWGVDFLRCSELLCLTFTTTGEHPTYYLIKVPEFRFVRRQSHLYQCVQLKLAAVQSGL